VEPKNSSQLSGNGALELQAQVAATELPQVRIDAPALIATMQISRSLTGESKEEFRHMVNPESQESNGGINYHPTSLLRSGMFAHCSDYNSNSCGTNGTLRKTVYRNRMAVQLYSYSW